MKKIIIHLLTIHLLVCTNQIRSVSLSVASSPPSTDAKLSQLNRLLQNDKQFVNNYAIDTVNYELRQDDAAHQQQINQPIKQPISATQSVKHQNCGFQHLKTGRLTLPSLALTERNLALSKSTKRNFDSIASNRRRPTRRGKVVGGELAYDGEFPWTVSIRKFDAHHCGGVIIGALWILTAGHCVSSQSNVPSQYTIRIGRFTPSVL